MGLGQNRIGEIDPYAPFSGAFDDVRIYSRVLNDDEIASLTRKEVLDEGLVLSCTFDYGDARDESGHGNDAILRGGVEIVEQDSMKDEQIILPSVTLETSFRQLFTPKMVFSKHNGGSVAHLTFVKHWGVLKEQQVYYTQSLDGGEHWLPPVQISFHNESGSRNIDVAIAAHHGDVLIVWSYQGDIHCSMSSDGGKTFGAAYPISIGVWKRMPSIVTDAQGQFHLAWREPMDFTAYTMSPTGQDGSWEPIERVSNIRCYPPSILVDNGYVYIAAREFSPHDQISVLRKSLGGDDWENMGTIKTSLFDDVPSYPRMAMDGQGRLYVVFEDGPSSDPNTPDRNPIYISYSSSQGRIWSEPVQIGVGYMPRIAVRDTHQVQVLWYRSMDGPDSIIFRQSDDRAQSWTAPQTLNQEGIYQIHWSSSSPWYADFLLGVPEIAAQGNTTLVAWVNHSQRIQIMRMIAKTESRVLRFDGQSPHAEDYMDLGQSDMIKPDFITLAAWIKPESPSVGQDQIFTHEHYGYRFSYTKNGLNFLITDPYADQTHPVFRSIQFAVPHVIRDKRWNHVAATYGSDRIIRLYVNGHLVGESQATTGGNGDIHYWTYDLARLHVTLGRGHRPLPSQAWRGGFHGDIDDVVIFNDALTKEDIRSLLLDGPRLDDPRLATYYSFDDGTAEDSSGNMGVLYGDIEIIKPTK